MPSALCARCRPLFGSARRQIPRLATRQQRRDESTDSSAASGTENQDQAQQGPREPKRKVVFSGIQPTGVPHLGNYLGALRQWKALQDEAQSSGSGDKLFFSVVDLHAITMPQEASVLRLRRREMLAALLAIGLDPDKGSTIFFQSSVPQHTELMWILSCTASMGYLGRMTQWKTKLQLHNRQADLGSEAISRLKLGLFSYPVLQAADILVHRTTHVPVGDDQRQHLEFARECATNFNSTFENILIPPETVTSPSPRIMSLSRPIEKMSKSAESHNSRILINYPEKEIQARVLRAVTDSWNAVTYEPEARPGVANLLEILAQCSPPSVVDGDGDGSSDGAADAEDKERLRRPTARELAARYADATLKDLKLDVIRAVCAELEGVRERHEELLYRKGGKWLDEIEAEGAEIARRNAEETMRMVRHAVGLGPQVV